MSTEFNALAYCNYHICQQGALSCDPQVPVSLKVAILLTRYGIGRRWTILAIFSPQARPGPRLWSPSLESVYIPQLSVPWESSVEEADER